MQCFNRVKTLKSFRYRAKLKAMQTSAESYLTEPLRGFLKTVADSQFENERRKVQVLKKHYS